MTPQDDRKIPEVTSDIKEDMPLVTDTTQLPDSQLKTTDPLAKLKYETAKTVLLIAMGGTAGLAILGTLTGVVKLENELIANAMEVFKLIAMAVLGFLFGSKSS